MRVTIEGVYGELTTFPGCATVCVSHAVYLPAAQRGKGKGTSANAERCLAAKELGYEYIVCTVKSTNTCQIRVLEKNYWTKLGAFDSERSDDVLQIWGKPL